jgi:hypothetical protein
MKKILSVVVIGLLMIFSYIAGWHHKARVVGAANSARNIALEQVPGERGSDNKQNWLCRNRYKKLHRSFPSRFVREPLAC